MNEHPIFVRVIFQKGQKTLHVYEKRVHSREGYSDAIRDSHEAFYAAHPSISLFDGVTVIYSSGAG